jgi:hypothetical protein
MARGLVNQLAELIDRQLAPAPECPIVRLPSTTVM